MNVDLILKDIKDFYTRENFRLVDEFLNEYPMLRGEWKFFEFVVTQAETNLRISHNLKFQPTDIIQTSSIGAGTLTFNYDKFNTETIDVTTTDAVTVRAFVGRYEDR